MIGALGMHRADDAKVVDVLGCFGKDLAHFDPALAVLLEREWGAEGAAGVALRLGIFAWQGLAVVLGERGLGVERVDLRRAAVQEQEDDLLGFRSKVRGAHRSCRGGSEGTVAEGAETGSKVASIWRRVIMSIHV